MKWNSNYNDLLNLSSSPYDILVHTGGRSGLKTGHSIRGILLDCLNNRKRARFFRETKDSIKESCKAELESIINQDFLNKGFEIGAETITNVNSGSYIFFKGLRDVNENSVQNLKGLATSTDIFYIDEAQAVSERVWNVLIDTLKKANRPPAKFYLLLQFASS
jgi:phage terminase large subunit